MNTISVVCKDESGEYGIKVPASDEKQALDLAISQGHVPVRLGTAAAQSRAYVAPGYLLSVANALGVVGFLLPICAFGAIVCGMVVHDRTHGEEGGTAIKMGLFSLIAWFILAVLIGLGR